MIDYILCDEGHHSELSWWWDGATLKQLYSSCPKMGQGLLDAWCDVTVTGPEKRMKAKAKLQPKHVK